MFAYASNLATGLGAVLTTISGVLILIFILAGLAGAFHNPYVQIVAFLFLPAIFVFGLILIPLGMWRRRRKLLAAGTAPEALPLFPRLDFNDPHLRRVATVVLGLTLVNAVILGASTYLGIEHMDSPVFCGETCHTVMQPEFTAYQQSPHSRVECVQCHIGPGASFFVRSKIDGLRQVWRTTFNTFDRPLSTPLLQLRPARETCEQCHWPAKHYGDKIRVFGRFSTDEATSPSYSAMLLKTGGGSLDTGRHGGVHWWHIFSDNRIRYVAADPRRQEIAWVELTTPDGEVRVYQRPGETELPADEIEAKARIMDCIDCHNRPTHLFRVPSKALDEVFMARPELLELPFLKRQALAAIKTEHPTHAEGVAAVRSSIEQYYRDSYPQIAADSAELVTEAAEAAAEIYSRSVFPEMKTDWTTHPYNIGHDDFPGCWRCHDDEMATADGAHVIPMDCETCHVFLVEDSPTPPDLTRLGL